MPVFRVEKNANYTTMSNHHLRDRNLSLKAKGLLSQFLSLPDFWQYNVKGLAAINRDGKSAVETALWELEKNGYVQRRQLRDKNGRLSTVEYIIFELPQPPPPPDLPLTENPSTVIPPPGNLLPENPAQLNTKLLNTKGLNPESNKAVPSLYGQYQNVVFTQAELDALKSEFPSDYAQRIEDLSQYMAMTGRQYQNHLATIRTWAAKERKQTLYGYSHSNYTFQEGESL